jgi:RecA-family ATPase
MARMNTVYSLTEDNGEPENVLLSECIGKPPVQADMIIEDLWFALTMGLFTGDGGIGKTHFALQLLYAIATGQGMSGLPFRPAKARPVVYITQEDEADFITGELLHLYPQLKTELVATHRIRVISTAVQGANLFLSNLKSARYIIDNIPEGGVFALDSWSTFLTSNENDATELLKNEILALRTIMKTTKATPLLLHHRPKKNTTTGAQGSFRGSTALPQHCRFHMMLESHGSGVRLSFEKVSRGVKPEPINLMFDEERRLFVANELDRYVAIFQPEEELATSEILQRLGLDAKDEKERAKVLDGLRRRSKANGPLKKVSEGKKGEDAKWMRKDTSIFC